MQDCNEPPSNIFSIVFKDRTADFSLRGEEIDPRPMFEFILGASYFVDHYHLSNKDKYDAEVESNDSDNEDKKKKVYHENKKQNLTMGRMLWRNLFLKLTMKMPKGDNELFPRAKHLVSLSNRKS